MAFRFAFAYVSLIVVLCLVMMESSSDCSNGYGCYYAEAALPNSNRKVSYGSNGKVLGSLGTNDKKGSLVGWELRSVPSGPDPLHHNGGSPKPKKPQTP